MSENDNLQEAEGKQEAQAPAQENQDTKAQAESTTEPVETVMKETEVEAEVEIETNETEAKAESDTTEELEGETTEAPKTEDEAVDEIEASNAKEAEDEPVKEVAEEKDYSSFTMETLVDEFEALLKNEEVQRLKDQVEGIKKAFNTKFSTLLEEKKKEFLDEGGNSIDFRFDFPLKKKFNEHFKEFRNKRKAYYDNLQKSFKVNLENRVEIIEEIKGLLNVEENINTTYKQFKALQERWRNAGPIPRDRYNNVWNNYHHHVENFYDFLHLNRDLRDLDFKHNLEQKQKLVARAEELVKEEDTNRSFRELQNLHKIWKEELGPVAKEYRDEIWERFKTATKAIHDKRQEYYGQLEEVYKQNLEKKNQIIEKITQEAEEAISNHSGWQKKIKQIEALRQEFFDAGKVPRKVNEATWSKFKGAVREFNRKKNAFYKDIKKEQFTNLQKKLDLIKVAEEHKDSTDFETTTQLMKKIQNEWKKIGHVPRKDSDKIWNQFKGACNHYFDKLRDHRNADTEEELNAFKEKEAFIKELKKVKFGDDHEANLALINEKTKQWRALGQVPRSKKNIEAAFQKSLNALYGKLDLSPEQAEMLKYENKLAGFKADDNQRLLDNEHNFVRKRIDEIQSEINQLENNLQFFSNVDSDNPLVKDVHTKIETQKAALSKWRTKFNKVKQFYS